MRSTVLRESELPHLPDDWELSAVEALAEINPEVLGAGAPQGFRFRYIDLSAVEKGRIDWSLVRETVFREAPSRARRPVRGGDVLFGTVRPALQSHAPIPVDEPGPLVASTGFAVLRARPEKADSRFLFNTVLSHLFSLQARRTEVGSNYPAVNESDVRAFLVPHPDLTGQRRIAAILNTLGDAIRRTEQVIAKLQQMKQGLLHDLLTRGVNEHGDLRPLPDEAPHLYKDSPLGRIPMGWDFEEIGRLGEVVTGSTPPSKVSGVWGTGLPFVTPGEVSADGTLTTSSRCLSEKGKKYVRAIPQKSILAVCIGSTLGKTAVTRVECATNQQINAVIPRTGLEAVFLDAALRVRIRKLLVLAGLQAVPIVNRTMFEGIQLAIAPWDEQLRVAQVLEGVEDRVGTEKGAATALRALQHGLLRDLLTGLVRVPLPAEASA